MATADTFQAIKNFLQPGKIEVCENSKLRIEEKAKQASLRLVNVASVGGNAFSIKYDECGFPGQAVELV